MLRNTVSQMVYKHAISTIVPARAIRWANAHDDDHDNGQADSSGGNV